MVLRKIGCDENYVGLIIILYFDEDQRSCIVVVGFLYFGLDHCAVVMLPDFC